MSNSNFIIRLILFLFLLKNLSAGEDDGVSVYFYHQMGGCGCFKHCSCFSHYIGPFRPGLEKLQNGAFPFDTAEHPKRPEDVKQK